jgi:hypothetical protein
MNSFPVNTHAPARARARARPPAPHLLLCLTHDRAHNTLSLLQVPIPEGVSAILNLRIATTMPQKQSADLLAVVEANPGHSGSARPIRPVAPSPA